MNPLTYVLASLNPPNLWSFYESLEAAAFDAEEANAYSKHLEKHGLPASHYEPMTYEAYEAAERQDYLTQPLEEISAERYEAMLSVLPPEHWEHGRLERFLLSEHWRGPYTSQYAAYRGRYFTRIVDATDTTTWITVSEIEQLMSQDKATKRAFFSH